MSKRDKKKVNRARRASAKAVPKATAAKRRPLSAYPRVGDAYDISEMLPETGCRMAGRLLVTERLWASVILSAPNLTTADWRIYDVAQWVKTLCVGDKWVEAAAKEWATQQAERGKLVDGFRWRALNNRTVEFWFFIEEEDAAVIDIIAASEYAEIRTLGHRIVFDASGCRITAIRDKVSGLSLTVTLRHGGERFEELGDYFGSVILPDGVTLTLNGSEIPQRVPERLIPSIRLSTVVYDAAEDRVRRCQRTTSVEVHPQHGASPMIYELGIPVDELPWQLRYDINVLQKTPLDTDRNMLPDKYKSKLVSLLVNPMSADYDRLMKKSKAVPTELQQDEGNADSLSEDARNTMIREMTGAEHEDIVRRNPFDKNDPDESGELEHKGYTPVDTRTAPPGLKKLLEGTPREHVKKLPKKCRVMFPIFEAFDYSGSNKRWKGKSKRTDEQRRCDKADRLFEKLVKGSDFERLDGYHALRHSFISILVAQGKTWDQIAAFVGHLDQRTTQRYIHFMPKDKRETANSIPFEF